jgi:hypothetical protein
LIGFEKLRRQHHASRVPLTSVVVDLKPDLARHEGLRSAALGSTGRPAPQAAAGSATSAVEKNRIPAATRGAARLCRLAAILRWRSQYPACRAGKAPAAEFVFDLKRLAAAPIYLRACRPIVRLCFRSPALQ